MTSRSIVMGAILFLVIECQGVILKQGTTYNNGIASYGMDGDDNTCAVSGFDFRPWLKVDLGEEKTFGSITVRGRDQHEDPPNIQIRIGSATGLEQDDEHLSNDICAAWPSGPVPLSEEYTFECARNLTGQHITIESTAQELEGKYVQLVICEVIPNPF